MSGAHISIGGRLVGSGRPAFIIAELSANHDGSLERALEIVAAAAAAGADAIKVQTYQPATMTLDSDQSWFTISGTIWNGQRLFDLYAQAVLPWDWHAPIQQACRDLGVMFFSSPFDATAVDFLEDMAVPAYKIASFELTDIPLLKRVAGTGRPIILSTGMATLGEIEEAVQTLHRNGAAALALLRCNSGYPAPPEEMDLRTIPHLMETFGVPVGLSDHTLRLEVPVAAVALGACIIEKHFTMSRADGGPDASFSLEPDEFRSMVEAVRTTERALGRVRYGPSPAEEASARFRRSIFAVRDLPPGHRISSTDVAVLRPAAGLHPRHLDDVVGSVTRAAVARGTPMAWSLIEPAGPDA